MIFKKVFSKYLDLSFSTPQIGKSAKKKKIYICPKLATNENLDLLFRVTPSSLSSLMLRSILFVFPYLFWK
jgi:hypothetical protein